MFTTLAVKFPGFFLIVVFVHGWSFLTSILDFKRLVSIFHTFHDVIEPLREASFQAVAVGWELRQSCSPYPMAGATELAAVEERGFCLYGWTTEGA